MPDNSYTLITGASSGRGEATAKLLSQDRNLMLHGRDLDKLNAVAKEYICGFFASCPTLWHGLMVPPFNVYSN